MKGYQKMNEPECWHLINQYDRKRTYLIYVTATVAEDLADFMEEVYELYCFESYEKAKKFMLTL